MATATEPATVGAVAGVATATEAAMTGAVAPAVAAGVTGGDALRLPAPGPSEPGRGERESAGAGWHIHEAGGVTLHTPALFDRLTAGVCLRVSTRPPRLD